MNLVSFSLWGSEDRYCLGAVANARLMPTVYPGWSMRVYCSPEVPVIEDLAALGVDVRVVPAAAGHGGLFWRFLPAAEADLDRVIVRDADSRVNPRERAAVDAWIASGAPFHVMRDHAEHRLAPMLGGMWGCRGGSLPDLPERIERWSGPGGKFGDQTFLRHEIWPQIADRCVVHSSVPDPLGGEPFPPHPPFDGFVGEIVDPRSEADETIALLLPSRGRPAAALAAARSAEETAAAPGRLRILVGVEADEWGAYRAAFGADESWVVPLRQGGHYVAAIRELHRAVDAGLYGLVADDFAFETPGWDARLRRAAAELPGRIGLLHGDDGIQGRRLATAPFLTAEWIARVGDILPGAYRHMYCDTELTDIARRAGRLRFLPDVSIAHRHPSAGLAASDATYQASSATMDAGRAEYRRREPERRRLAAALTRDAHRPDPSRPRRREPGPPGWPKPEQELLLTAALGSGEGATAAWRAWTLRAGPDRVDPAGARLLPLAFWNLRRVGVPEASLEGLQPFYREAWAASHALQALARERTESFREVGIPAMLLKGAALARGAYARPELRPMSDVDLLVPASRAAAARRHLRDHGWRPTEALPEARLRLLPGASFEDGEGRLLDLHWHALLEGCRPASDDGFWARAEPIDLDGAEALTLSPADQLLQVCVHGQHWAPVPAIHWVADAVAILRSAGGRIDWEVLLAEARARRVVLAMRRALGYLRSRFHEGDDGLDAAWRRLLLDAVPLSERIEYHARVRPPALARGLALHWLDQARFDEGSAWPARLARFPAYCRDLWGLDTAWAVPAAAARKAVRRLLGGGAA